VREKQGQKRFTAEYAEERKGKVKREKSGRYEDNFNCEGTFPFSMFCFNFASFAVNDLTI